MKYFLIGILILISAHRGMAAEIDECFLNEHFTAQEFSTLIQNNFIKTVSQTNPLSKPYCDSLSWMNKKVEILSLGLSASGVACLAFPEPVSKPISAVLLISGFGLQSISFLIKGDLETCEKQAQEKEVKEILRGYLKTNGATVK